MCVLFGKSKQAYFKSNDNATLHRLARETFAIQYIKDVRKKDPGIGGLKLWHMYKRDLGENNTLGRDKFYDIIDANGFKLRDRLRKPRTTDSSHGLPVFKNLVKEFIPTKPNQLWVSDITYITICPSDEKYYFCYLSLILDSYTEEIPATGHNYVDGVCTKCNTPPAGLYDASGTMLCSWEDSGIDVETDYSGSSDAENYYQTSPTSPYYVLTKNYSTATKVVIPDGVTEIGQSAFDFCSSLTSVVIPDSVKTIGNSAFFCCTSLTSVEIGKSVESIGSRAFLNCTGLSSVTIPDSVTTIGAGAFNSVPHIYYNGSATGSPWGEKAIN